MPAISSGKVFITGTNGFIGAWTLKTFLDAGFSVRAAIRSEGKATHIKKQFSSFGDKLEFAIVPDIAKEGAFDEALFGVDAVVHVASPTDFGADHPDELIVPAVNSTLGILRAATKVPSVKRIITLSSAAAVYETTSVGPNTWDESNWNVADVEAVKKEGRAASQRAKYFARKTLAEQSAWAFYREQKEKGAIGYDFVSVCPPYVLGPILHEFDGKAENINHSNAFLYNAVIKGEFFPTDDSYVDVYDLTKAILLAITTPAAGGERFVISAGQFRWEDFIIIAHKLSGGRTRPPSQSYNPDAVYQKVLNAAKSKEILGIEYRSKEDTVKDVLQDYEKYGWI